MKDFVNLCLLKAENPEAYKKLASTGIMVGFSASIGGITHRPDINMPYHSTVKFFNPDKDNVQDIHHVARTLNLVPPDPKQTHIEPSVFKDRLGNDVYVIKLHGPHADSIKEHNKKFSHMGYPTTYEYTPHVSVDKKTWDKIVASKAKTAHEAGIEFGPAELKQGHNTLATYHHGKPTSEETIGTPSSSEKKPEKLAASELEKGVKDTLTALGVAGAMAIASPSETGGAASNKNPSSDYSRPKMLQVISHVESTDGKFTNHKELGGIHDGEKAYGKYGLTPIIIRETINLHRDLKAKHKKALALQGQHLHNYMQDNPGLEDAIAERHLKRLEHHFGQDPAAIGHAWLQGIRGTYKAKQENSIHNHWHVAKIKHAYYRGK